MESLKRMREPLAWGLIALAALTLALQAVGLVQRVAEIGRVRVTVIGPGHYQVEMSGDEAGELSMGEQLAAVTAVGDWSSGLRELDQLLLLALVVAVAACSVGPAVARARRLALAAAWTASLSVGLAWGFAGFALRAWQPAEEVWLPAVLVDGLAPALNSGTAVLATIALWALARRPRATTGGEATDAPAAEPVAVVAEDPSVWQPPAPIESNDPPRSWSRSAG